MTTIKFGYLWFTVLEDEPNTFNGKFFQNEVWSLNVYIIPNAPPQKNCRVRFRSEGCLEQHRNREFDCSKVCFLI